MRLLITGGAGFIGSNLVRLMIQSGHEVLNVDKLTYAGNTRSLVDIESTPRTDSRKQTSLTRKALGHYSSLSSPMQ